MIHILKLLLPLLRLIIFLLGGTLFYLLNFATFLLAFIWYFSINKSIKECKTIDFYQHRQWQAVNWAYKTPFDFLIKRKTYPE